ncbi:POK19 protein, partial [Dyaphorophyia castanea]|nr:POK19 protein [Platysteira castanea]
VEHTTGIPHSPTGQSVAERTHQTLKRILEQQRGGNEINGPVVRLSKALFTLNFLNCSFEELNPPVLRHFMNSTSIKLKGKPPVLIKDPESCQIQDPYP